MKILVLELARLGDILQSWPALRALKRTNPNAEIHVLTRDRFKAALEGNIAVDKIHLLPSREWVAPLVEKDFNVKAAHDLIGEFLTKMKAENFDWIINFSFSPISSYITHAVAGANTRVSGYTRTADGFLAIPDDMSAYFYAQVGHLKPNRYHLAEIFATMVGADLIALDWAPPMGTKRQVGTANILIHVGASEVRKSISAVKWTTIINQFQKIFTDRQQVKIGIIGVAAESALAEQIMASVPEGSVENYVGKTNFKELFELIGSAGLLVGADSAPMHMASLTATPCLNLSLSSVNFWETGPRAPRSVVLKGNDETDFVSDTVANAMRKILMGEKADLSAVTVQEGAPSYWCLEPRGADFQWKFIKAIYMNESFPLNNQPLFKDGIYKLDDINSLMIEQLEKLQKGVEIAKIGSIIDRGEDIIQTISKLVPDLSPLIRWYNTEKIRLGPDSHEVLVQKCLGIHMLLQKVLDLYKEFYNEASVPESILMSASASVSEE